MGKYSTSSQASSRHRDYTNDYSPHGEGNGIKFEGLKVDSGVVVSSTNPTAVFTAIKERDWAALVNICRKGEESHAGTWIVEKNLDGSVRWKLLPLHQACETKAPSEVVKSLIAAYPQAVSMKDSGGDLPLHLACRAKSSKAVVAALVMEDPTAAKVTDDEGRLPLHLACRQGCGIGIIDDLIVANHNAALTPDSYLLLPLHWACAQNAPLQVVESLLRAYPEGVNAEDKWGRTPTSLCSASTNKEKAEIIEALRRDPSYWTTSLIDEIDNLKYKLEAKDSNEIATNARASSLEQKLAEVTQASSSAAHTFRSLKNELESENADLRTKLRNMTVVHNETEMRKEKLESDNARLKRDIKTLTSRLNEAADIFRNMEEQRLKLLTVTGNMEDNLEKASEIAKE